MLVRHVTTFAALAVFVGSAFALLPVPEQPKMKQHKMHKEYNKNKDQDQDKDNSQPSQPAAPPSQTSTNNTGQPFDEVGAIPMTFKCGKFNKANTNCGFDTSQDSDQLWVAVPSTAGHAIW